MHYNMTRKTIISAAICLLLFGSCGNLFDDAAYIPLVELGAEQSEFLIPAEGGEEEVSILSNGEYTLQLFEGCDWVSLGQTSGCGDGKVRFSVSRNDGFKRRTGIILVSGINSKKDTLLIKQDAFVDAVLDVKSASLLSSGSGGVQTYTINTNIKIQDMKVDFNYISSSSANWISAFDIETNGENSLMKITTDANLSEEPRIARVIISFTNGWQETVKQEFNLIQKNCREEFGKVISFSDLKNEYSEGDVISEYLVIEGFVVSNTEGGNAGENEQVTATTIDYTGSQKTVYFESLDGKYGLVLETTTAEDNVFNQFDKVSFLLKGATFRKMESPQRFGLAGLTKDMVMSVTGCSKKDIPVKEKHIADLTDDDIYTYVTLLDVEIPVRKGPLVPVNEGFAIGTNAHRISKYPRLIRDINGDVSYLMTNTVCLYRNDGSVLPYGSGKMSGVLVHERFTRFEFKNGANIYDIDTDPELGFISRYQLRHQTKSDIWEQMEPSVENSFSALLTEYRFVNPDPDAATTHSALPTYGTNGRLTHTYQYNFTRDSLKHRIYQNDMSINFVWTFSYLGPIGNNKNNFFGYNVGNENGIGVILDPKKEHWPQWASWQNLISTAPDGTLEWCGPYATSEDARNINLFNGSDQPGKGICPWGTKTGFSNQYWWDSKSGKAYGWLLEFSTKGIATNHISLQFTALNYERYTPRYWKIEWSEESEQNDANWHEIGQYTVPDRTEWSVATVASISAFKQYNFELPLEILGKEKVFIRLVPRSNLVSSGADYADCTFGTDGKVEHESAINYIAIRYNK